MILLTQTEQPSCTVITIDGQLSDESIPIVETCCGHAESKGKPVQLVLRDVTTVDQAGQVLLRRLSARGVRLLGRGVYTSYLVQALGPGKGGNGSLPAA